MRVASTVNNPDQAISPTADGVSPALAFEREKWIAECEFRRQDLEIRSREEDRLREKLKIKARERRSDRWLNPLVLAIVGATIAGMTNIVADIYSADSQLNDEAVKAESERILKVIGPDTDQTVKDLKFLAQVGLISGDLKRNMESFLAAAPKKQIPSLGGLSLSSAVHFAVQNALTQDGKRFDPKQMMNQPPYNFATPALMRNFLLDVAQQLAVNNPPTMLNVDSLDISECM